MRKSNAPGAVFRRWVCLLLAAILMLGLVACTSGDAQEPLRAPTESAVATVSVETAYGALEFPEALHANLQHTEVTEGSIAMEVFSMIGTDGEKELYRIHYADEQVGTLLGYLQLDQGEIPVSYSMCEYMDEDFANEDDRQLYYEMMNAFSVVMNSIYADPRFSETRSMEPVGEQEVQLRYWKLTLPENVQCTETEENGNYQVFFHGEVSGEQIQLYMIGLGELEAESELGWYTVDGVQKPIKIQTCDMAAYETWSEENRLMIYRMMDSLNSTIQTIVADPNYAEYQEAE